MIRAKDKYDTKYEMLTLLTTADSSSSVMLSFADSAEKFALKTGLTLRWIIVDGLHTVSSITHLLRPNLHVECLTPPERLDQLSAVVYGLDNIEDQTLVIDPDMGRNLTDIPKFMKKIHEGYDIILGWRKERRGISKTRQYLTKLYNILFVKITGLKIHDPNTPMIMISCSGIHTLKCRDINSNPQIYLYSTLRQKVAEVPIITEEMPERESNYNTTSRMITGIKRTTVLLYSAKNYQRQSRKTKLIDTL